MSTDNLHVNTQLSCQHTSLMSTDNRKESMELVSNALSTMTFVSGRAQQTAVTSTRNIERCGDGKRVDSQTIGQKEGWLVNHRTERGLTHKPWDRKRADSQTMGQKEGWVTTYGQKEGWLTNHRTKIGLTDSQAIGQKQGWLTHKP